MYLNIRKKKECCGHLVRFPIEMQICDTMRKEWM